MPRRSVALCQMCQMCQAAGSHGLFGLEVPRDCGTFLAHLTTENRNTGQHYTTLQVRQAIESIALVCCVLLRLLHDTRIQNPPPQGVGVRVPFPAPASFNTHLQHFLPFAAACIALLVCIGRLLRPLRPAILDWPWPKIKSDELLLCRRGLADRAHRGVGEPALDRNRVVGFGDAVRVAQMDHARLPA